MQSLLSRQRGKFNFTLAYTFSKSLGIRAAGSTATAVGSEYLKDTSGNPVDIRNFNYGVAAFDRTHVATASYSWHVRRRQARRLRERHPRRLAGHRHLDLHQRCAPAGGHQHELRDDGHDGRRDRRSAPRAVSGSPTVPAQPILTCDPTADVPEGFYFNPSCFTAPVARAATGTSSSRTSRGSPTRTTTCRSSRTSAIGARDRSCSSGSSAYNVFNHPIAFPDPTTNLTLNFNNGVLSNPEFAKKNEDNKFGRRIVQLALRYTF